MHLQRSYANTYLHYTKAKLAEQRAEDLIKESELNNWTQGKIRRNQIRASETGVEAEKGRKKVSKMVESEFFLRASW